jgi:hypothetical protein
MGNFIIIGGMARSGTNLTRRIIGSHSQVAIPPAEFQFFKRHHQGKSVQQILSNKRLAQWNLDLSDLYDLDPREVYVKTLQRYADQRGKKIPGEKTPYNEFYLDTIETWLEGFEFKFILMVRNPFDVLASYKHKPFGVGIDPNDDAWIPAFVENWRRSVSMGLAKANTQPEHYAVLKYEDLTRDTITKTKELCHFLGIEFEKERMLSFSDFANNKDNTSFSSDQQTQAQGKIYQPPSRKKHLTKTEIEAVRSTCGELAWALGYLDEDFTPSPPLQRSQPKLEKRFLHLSKSLRSVLRGEKRRS